MIPHPKWQGENSRPAKPVKPGRDNGSESYQMRKSMESLTSSVDCVLAIHS